MLSPGVGRVLCTLTGAVWFLCCCLSCHRLGNFYIMLFVYNGILFARHESYTPRRTGMQWVAFFASVHIPALSIICGSQILQTRFHALLVCVNKDRVIKNHPPYNMGRVICCSFCEHYRLTVAVVRCYADRTGKHLTDRRYAFVPMFASAHFGINIYTFLRSWARKMFAAHQSH